MWELVGGCYWGECIRGGRNAAEWRGNGGYVEMGVTVICDYRCLVSLVQLFGLGWLCPWYSPEC